jgi:hypothetical protein
MKLKKVYKIFTAILVIVVVGWTALTFYVEKTGPSMEWSYGNNQNRKVLVIYDPDPFYNLDEQISKSFATALAENGYFVDVVTVRAAEQKKTSSYIAMVYAANTYNWRPDWAITNYIKSHAHLKKVPSIAITLGAGSTAASQKYLEHVITDHGGNLIGSFSLWLWRPNDETKIKEPNVAVANAMAYQWGKQMAANIKQP